MSEQDELKINVIKSPDYRKVYASGFWGGLNNHGDLQIDIYEDGLSLPEELKLEETDERQGVYKEKVESKEYEIERTVHLGATIPAEALPNIIWWLQSKYDQYIQETNQNDE